MALILAVFLDLYTFARDAVLGIVRPVRFRRPAATYLLGAAPARPQLPESAPAPLETREEDDEAREEEAIIIPTFRSTAEILETPGTKNTVMYAGSEFVPLYRHAAMEFDGAFARIPYGAMVMVLESKGRWSRVVWKSLQGWAIRDELVDRSAYVYPDFTIGEPNRAEDPNTLRLRACIADEFGAGRAELPLQSSEYVLYRLTKRGVAIPWPEERPRVEGRWHALLKGRPGVQIGVRACAGCAMEYATEEGAGHLALVESVLPDETVTISEANFPSDGIYNERVMTKEEWIELKPVFIQFQ
jgi:hypothetical protein